jgi:hypothetical protein
MEEVGYSQERSEKSYEFLDRQGGTGILLSM